MCYNAGNGHGGEGAAMHLMEFAEGLAEWGAPIGMKLGMVCLYAIAYLPEIIAMLYVIAVGLFLLYLALIAFAPVLEEWYLRRFCERRGAAYNDASPSGTDGGSIVTCEGTPGGNPASSPDPLGCGDAAADETPRR